MYALICKSKKINILIIIDIKKAKNMKNKNIPIIDNRIDLEKITKVLLKKWLLILTSGLLFLLCGFLYSHSQPVKFKTQIKLKEATSSIFEEFRPLLTSIKVQTNLTNAFKFDFNVSLLSKDIINSFINQNEKYDEFVPVFDKVSQDKFDKVSQDKKDKSIYYFTYFGKLSGSEFLDDYIFFVKKLIEEKYKKLIIKMVHSEIKIIKKNLDIARKINLDNPILKDMVDGNSVVNEPDSLFYKGTFVLTEELVYLKNFLDNSDDYSLLYMPTIEKASIPIRVSQNKAFYSAVAFLVGLIFSVCIIILRFILLRKS